jgi:hypothetical protein
MKNYTSSNKSVILQSNDSQTHISEFQSKVEQIGYVRSIHSVALYPI